MGGDIFNGSGGSPDEVMLVVGRGGIDVFRRSYEDDRVLIDDRPIKIERSAALDGAPKLADGL